MVFLLLGVEDSLNIPTRRGGTMGDSKGLVRRIYDEVLNGRNLDVLDEVARADYI